MRKLAQDAAFLHATPGRGAATVRDMFGTFSSSAMAAVGRAQDFAADRGSTDINAADIVLAVLARLGSAADQSLAALGDALAKRSAVEPAGPPPVVDPDQLDRLSRSAFTDRFPGQRLPFAESAIATFRAAWKKAKWDGRKQVDEYDLLTAAIEQPALAEPRSAAGIVLDSIRPVISGLRQFETGPGTGARARHQ